MKLFVRADASSSIGTGHVMRSMALAQEWAARGGAVEYLCAEIPEALERRLGAEGFGLRRLACERGSEADLAATDAATTGTNCWLVLDGYLFDERWHKRLRNTRRRLLCIDDYAQCATWDVDAIVSPHAYARPATYTPRATGCQVFVGPGALLLRREFLAQLPAPRDVAETVGTVLISMGGSDPRGCTAVAIDATMAALGTGVSIVAVLGGGVPDVAARSLMGAFPAVQFVRASDDMAALMRAADLAVIACGGTTWECAAMRLPAVAVKVADNQAQLADYLRGLGWFPVVDAESATTELAGAIASLRTKAARLRFVEAASELVKANPVATICDGLEGASLSVRRATLDDAALLFAWANDEETRRLSIQTARIEWESHVAWLTGRLTRATTRLSIVEAPLTGPLGQVRFDVDGDRWWISISVDHRYRGRRWGGRCLAVAIAAFRADHPRERIFATVRVENAASQSMFARAGFVRVGQTLRGAALCDDFVLEPASDEP